MKLRPPPNTPLLGAAPFATLACIACLLLAGCESSAGELLAGSATAAGSGSAPGEGPVAGADKPVAAPALSASAPAVAASAAEPCTPEPPGYRALATVASSHAQADDVTFRVMAPAAPGRTVTVV